MAAVVASVGSPSPTPSSSKGTAMGSCASPSFSPASDKRFWSGLRTRVDTLLEKKRSGGEEIPAEELDRPSSGEVGNAKRLRQDTALLLRGFDSVAHTLSQLSSNIDNALQLMSSNGVTSLACLSNLSSNVINASQGARDLAKPPTMTEILHSSLNKTEVNDNLNKGDSKDGEEGGNKGSKRKFDDHTSEEDLVNGDAEGSPKDKILKKAKNLAVSMASKASFLARELKSIKTDLVFMQERCALLEEENDMLRHGFTKGIRPEEDDLVRLQLEALLTEKSRLANEKANLTRENQCLRQLVEYHQATSQDLSASYEEVLNGICLDFSSPSSPTAEAPYSNGERDDDGSHTPSAKHFEFSTNLDYNGYKEDDLQGIFQL